MRPNRTSTFRRRRFKKRLGGLEALEARHLLASDLAIFDAAELNAEVRDHQPAQRIAGLDGQVEQLGRIGDVVDQRG